MHNFFSDLDMLLHWYTISSPMSIWLNRVMKVREGQIVSNLFQFIKVGDLTKLSKTYLNNPSISVPFSLKKAIHASTI